MSNDSSAADSLLADRLEAMSATLVARSLDYMPHDEFWERRYAARAGRFAREDGGFHVRYLVDALRAGSPTVMAQYAKWLRDLLVPRGMCTLHLAEHFEHLSRAVEAEGAVPALRYMRAGIDALSYDDGTPAAAVQRAADGIARDVESLSPAPAGASRNSAWETRYLCHYTADALARMDPALLSSHVSWARDLYAADHGSADPFDAWLDAVSRSLAAIDVPTEFLAVAGRRNS